MALIKICTYLTDLSQSIGIACSMYRQTMPMVYVGWIADKYRAHPVITSEGMVPPTDAEIMAANPNMVRLPIPERYGYAYVNKLYVREICVEPTAAVVLTATLPEPTTLPATMPLMSMQASQEYIRTTAEADTLRAAIAAALA